MSSPKRHPKKSPKHRIPKEHWLRLRDGGALGGKKGGKGYDRKELGKVGADEQET